MEKAAATKAKKKSFLKIIPKAAHAAAVSFQNLPFSPRRDNRTDANAPHRHKSHFSGPMIPVEARGRSKTAETPEPSSPKVSCIGQIKYKNSLSSKKKHDPRKIASSKAKKTKPISAESSSATERKKKTSGIMKIFSGGRKSDAAIDQLKSPSTAGDEDNPPRLNQMRKFASSRDTLANFDWTAAQIAPAEEHDDREFYSDDGDDDVIIPFSAPIIGSGAGLELEPRKEINLWKRRTMARPKPLQLD